MMNVIDTSVVTKWLFRELDSDIAIAILENEQEYFAPDYLRIEFQSTVSKKIRTGLITIEEGQRRLDDFRKFNFYYKSFEEIEHLSFELSAHYPITFYDAMFLALAIQQNAYLITFDRRLKRSVIRTELEELVVIPV